MGSVADDVRRRNFLGAFAQRSASSPCCPFENIPEIARVMNFVSMLRTDPITARLSGTLDFLNLLRQSIEHFAQFVVFSFRVIRDDLNIKSCRKGAGKNLTRFCQKGEMPPPKVLID